jgi:chaperone required for assembly of F1-ATPase
MKRLYTTVTAEAVAEGWRVMLDGRPLRTPARKPLLVPGEALARAVAVEWQEQGEQIDTQGMRLTRLATTVVDLMPERRGDAIAEAAGYAATDLLCYRAASPASLAARQQEAWQPWLDWAERRFDARLKVASGVMPASQDDLALRSLRAAVERLDDWRLVGLHAATTTTGSLILGLAVAAGDLGAEAAFAASVLDETFEIEQWGEDKEQSARRERLRADLEAAERFLALVPQGAGATRSM